MKKYHVIFHTDTNWNGRCETVEAEDKGSVKAKLREKYGKVYVMSCYEISS